jgi:general secretion pathway protein K
VLVTLLFATAAVIAFVEKAGDDLIVPSRDATAQRLRREAYSSLEVTLAVLEDFRLVNNGLHSPAEGWSDPLGFAGWTPRDGCTVEISFEDESGKLSLPHIDQATFKNLFEQWGISRTDADKLTDVLLAWMKKDYVASARAPDYEQSSLPYAAPLRSMRTYTELAAIDFARDVFYDRDGRPNELWRRFASTISLLDFQKTNLNSTGGDVVVALGQLDRSQQQQLTNYLNGTGDRARSGPSFFQSTADAAKTLGVSALPNAYGTEISALRINVTVHQGRSAFRLSTVVAPTGGATTVKGTAQTNQLTTTTNSAANSSTPTPATAAAASTDATKKLNYPFTLLEIKENAEISSSAVSPNKA